MSFRSYLRRSRKRWFIIGTGLVFGIVLTLSLVHPDARSPASPKSSSLSIGGSVVPDKPRLDLTKENSSRVGAWRGTGTFEEQSAPSVRIPSGRAVSPAIAAALPGLTEVLNDWRKFRPDELTVAPHPDLPITFKRIAIKDEGRYVTWIGRNPLMPGASLVAVATVTGYDAILVIPGAGEFGFHVQGDAMVINEVMPGDESCGVEPLQPARAPHEAGASVIEINYAAGFDPDAGIVAATAAPNVDVLFAYDASTLEAANAASNGHGAEYIENRAKAMVETANVALSQSGVSAFAWRYLGVVAAPPYARTGNLDLLDDLNALAPGGALADWVKTTRYQRGADEVMLLVGGTADFAGRAFSPKQKATSPDWAVAVMLWTASSQTMAHELAHNFGCQHDRAHVDTTADGQYGPPVPDNDGFWCYGQLWDNGPLPPGWTGNPGTGGTVMSYADWRIPYFSNPNITLRLTGSLLGWNVNPDLGTRQIGQPETAPAAAYNVKVLSDQAQAMSAISEEIAAPAITEQPQGASTPRGQYFTLKVKATGGGLSYQWMKNNMAIGGAQDSTYSKVADVSEPDGYSVVISNLAGSVTSNVVTVTVTAPAAPSSSGSSGGGGGGGALGAWFCGTFLGLFALRWLSPQFFARMRH